MHSIDGKIENMTVAIFGSNNSSTGLNYFLTPNLMPSPFASSKFVLSVLKFLGVLKFLRYTQNILGIFK